MAYCEASDLYSYGLPRGAVPNPGKLVASVDTSADTLELDVHGLALNDAVMFRAEAGGSLPSPLVAGTTYYAIPTSESYFQVAATANGAAIDLTTSGSRVILLVPLQTDAAIEWASAIVDDMLPSHVVPLESPYPTVIVATVAELAVSKLLAGRAQSESLTKMIDAAMKRVERWGKGVPLRGTNAPTDERATNVATSATVPYSDARGWREFGGL